MSRFVVAASSARASFHACPRPVAHGHCETIHRGYIADRRELADTLRSAAIDVGDESEAALFAGSYRRWGSALAAHVLGEYSLVLWHPHDRTLLVTHDALGISPVYYAERDGCLIAASHLDEMLRVIEPGAIDDDYLADHLLLARHDPARTPFRAIRRLLPGSSLVCHDGTVQVVRTWSFRDVGAASPVTPEDRCEQFRALLARAVRAAIPESGNVWAELSGGLDSSSIVSVARRGGADVTAFSLVFSRSKHADERPWMRQVVRKYNCPWVCLDLDAFTPFSRQPTRFLADPNSSIPYFAMTEEYESRAEAHGVSVVLSGNGGDHVLLGDDPDPVYLADDLRRCGRLGRVRQGITDWQTAPDLHRSLRYHLWRYVAQPLSNYWRGRAVAPMTLPRAPTWAGSRLKELARGRRAGLSLPYRCRSVGDQYFAERVWAFAEVNGTNLSQTLRTFSYRYPLLYRPLVELMFRTPWSEKIRPGVDRVLQRRALKGVLPETIRTRHTKGGPDEAVFDGLRRSTAWRALLERPSRLAESGLIDGREWSLAVSRAQFGQVREVSLFLQNVTLEFWLQQLDRRPAPDLAGWLA